MSQAVHLLSLLFTDEGYFVRERALNQPNDDHVWSLENTKGPRLLAAQWRFLLNVWADILGDYFIGLHLLTSPLDCRIYLIILKNVLPKLLDVVHFPSSFCRCMWYHNNFRPRPLPTSRIVRLCEALFLLSDQDPRRTSLLTTNMPRTLNKKGKKREIETEQI